MDYFNMVLGMVASVLSIYATITSYQTKKTVLKNIQKDINTNGDVVQENNTKIK